MRILRNPYNFDSTCEYYCAGTPDCYICNCGGDKFKCELQPTKKKDYEISNFSETDREELEFYRDYIYNHDLVFDAYSEFLEWKKRKNVTDKKINDANRAEYVSW